MLPFPKYSAQTKDSESEEAQHEEAEELKKLLPYRDSNTAAHMIEQMQNDPEEHSDIVESEIYPSDRD